MGSLAHFVQRGGIYAEWIKKQQDRPWIRFGFSQKFWSVMSKDSQKSCYRRYAAGFRGEELLFDSRLVKSAKSVNVSVVVWAKLGTLVRQTVRRRFKAGWSNSELLAGIVA